MLQNEPFYHGSIRKVVESFGAVFSDLHIVRTRLNGTTYQTIHVPCEYGPKEKWYIRNTQNPMPGVDDSVEMVLPRMSYELKNWQYDTSRKITSTGRTVKAITNSRGVLKTQFNPVPYNLSFELNIMAKNVEDGHMIIEQILPFFTPDYTISVNDMPELSLEKDIVLVHNGVVEYQDSWEGNFDRRTVTWTLGFVAKAYIYPPVKLKNVTLEADIRWNVLDGVNGAVPTSVITPLPALADATTVTDGRDVVTDDRVVIVPEITSAAVFGGHSATFRVTVVNATNTQFTPIVPTTAQTTNDTYSSDQAHGTFTYNCGTGARTMQENITITFVSVQDPNQSSTVTLVLNP